MKANRIVFTVLLSLSFFVFTFNVISQDSDIDPHEISPDVDLFQSYLDSADQRAVSEQWLDYARFGLESVLASWEKEVLLLAGDDVDITELRSGAEGELNEIMKSRYADWLNSNFFKAIDPPSLGGLDREIEALNEQYLYDIDDEGNIVYKNTVDYSDVFTTDAMGNETLVKKGEKTLWVEGVKARISAMLEDWSQKMTTAFADLKATISDGEILEELESGYEHTYAGWEQAYRDQLYRLYNMEQSRFTRLRLYDQYSLEYESEQETASRVSSELIASTEAELNSSLDALVSSLNAQASAADGEGGIINADDWRESFQALLDQGLSSWDEAEQELLIRRIEWEQDAAAEVAEGEEAWAEAFYQLSGKRTEWMNNFMETLEEGNQLWAEENQALEEAIEKAVAEIDENIANSEASLQSRIDNLVGMLLQSVNMMRTARTSWEYWMDRFDQGGKGSFDAGGVDYDYDSMITAMSKIRPELSGADRENDEVYQEAIYWAGLFSTYQVYAAEAQGSLAETYGIVVFDNASLQTAFSGNALDDALIDDDILLDQDAWEAIYLDEYQVELLKARAYLQYWQKQQKIAQAVYEYAEDNSSTKETAGETEAALSEAKAAYDEALAVYSAGLDRLSNISIDMESLQSDMETIQEEINGYQQQLAAAREQYNSTLTDLEVDNTEYLAAQYRDYYLQLLESMGMSDDSERSPASALEAYLLAAKEYGYEEQISLVSKRVVELLSGGQHPDLTESLFNAETASLTELRARMQTLAAAGFVVGASTEQYFGFMGNESAVNQFDTYLQDYLLLSHSDYRYGKLMEYFTEYNNADTGEDERAMLLWQMQLIAKDIQNEAGMYYELRLAELRLLTTDDYSEWALQYFGEESDDPEELIEAQESSFSWDLSGAIKEDLDIYEEILGLYQQHPAAGSAFVIYEWGTEEENLPLEISRLQALQALWDNIGGEPEAEKVSEISAMVESLKALSSWLQAVGNPQDNIDIIEAAILNPDEGLGQQYLKTYLNGRHNLISVLGDMYSVIYADSIKQKAYALSLAEILGENISYAPSLSSYGYEKSKDQLIDTLRQFGVINDQSAFISPEAVWAGCAFAGAGDVADFFHELDIAADSMVLPDYLSGILSSYTAELRDFFAVKAAMSFPAEFSSELNGINEQIKSASGSLNRLSALASLLQNTGDQSIKLLRIAESDELPEQMRREAERRFIETAGFDLAHDALRQQDFSGSDAEWSVLFNAYISAARTGLNREDGLDDYSAAIIERAGELFVLSSALADPDSINWAEASEELIESYRAMLWNRLTFDEALDRITGTDSSLNISDLVQLRLTEQSMTEDQIEQLLAVQIPEITELAVREQGDIYQRISAFGIGSVLVENAGYSLEQAADFVNWFMEARDFDLSISRDELADYLAIGEEQRLYSLLETNEDAALHFIRKKITRGGFSAEELSMLLDSMELSSDERTELTSLQGMLDDITVYNELLHGDFEDYIKTKYPDKQQQRQIREMYMRFRGSPAVQWDDSIFLLPLDYSADANVILENLAFNRTKGENNSHLNPETSLSANDVFISEALSESYSLMYEGESSLSNELAGLRYSRELQSRAADYLQSLETPDSDNWRSFLTAEYLESEDDELELVPGTTTGPYSSDYERDLQIGEGGGDVIIEDFNSLTLFSGTGNDQQNQVLDAFNSYLDSAAYLTAAIKNWQPSAGTGPDPGLSKLNDELGSGEVDFGYVLYEGDAGIENNYNEGRLGFYSLLAEIESLKGNLSRLGYRRERLKRLSELNGNQQLAELKPLSDEISALEDSIEAAQSGWQALIDGEDGYRILEQEYAAVFEEAKEAYKQLEDLKQEYSTARAVYQYASSGYLSVDEEILTEFDPVEDDSEADEAPDEEETKAESGITGGTAVASDVEVDEPTADQSYRDALLTTINKVSPAERLSYINEKLSRAQAAHDALEIIINDGSVKEPIYSKDQVYRTYFDNYLKTFRESLVLNKINHILNGATAKQEKTTSDALAAWNRSIHETYLTPGYLDENGEAKIPDGLDGCTISSSGDGNWDISWGGSGSSADTFRQYFEPNPDSETGFSDFENDLMSWLENINVLIDSGKAQETFTTWAMALKWEEYLAEGSPSDITNEFWSSYLNKNGEEDLDKEGAKSLLISKWQKAYNTVNSSEYENKKHFNFYKMMAKGGIMQSDLDSEEGGFGADFDILADKESIVLANKYMADEYQKGAESLIIASIPMFAMAAVYYAAGALALAFGGPLGWIAAIAIFAAAVAMTLGASMLLGEGYNKNAAAKQIREGVVTPAEEQISEFMRGYESSTDSVFSKKQEYETEYKKLQQMRGAPETDVTLTDEKRVELMTSSAVTAFANEGEDLHDLLVKGGLVAESGDAASDAAALKLLFSGYQEKMSLSERAQCVNSSLFISALEEQAQDSKQIAARELNDYLTDEDGAARKQAEAESDYQNAYYRYLAEEIDLEEYKEAAKTAFENPAFSVREHLLRLYEQQNAIAEMIMGSDQFNADTGVELLESQKLLLCGNNIQKGIYDYRMSNYRDVRVYEMQMLRLEMSEKYRNWENQMRAITARGELEWSAGERKLTRKYRQWQDDSKRLYDRQAEAWDDKYLDFLGDKQAWLDAVTVQSSKVGDMDALVNFGEMTSAAITAAGADILITEPDGLAVDPDQILSEIVDFDLLGRLLEGAQSLNDSIGDTENLIFSAAAADSFTSADSLQAIKDFQAVQNEDYQKHLAELEYIRMLEQVEAAEESFYASIDSANKNIDESMNRTMRNDGYIRNGDEYEKQLVVGDTIGDYIYDDGYVSAYEDYDPGDVDFGGELRDAKSNVENLDSEGLQGLVSRAMDSIQDKLEEIFGEDDEESLTISRDDLSVEEESGFLESAVDWVAEIIGIKEFMDNLASTSDREPQETAEIDPAIAELSPGYFGEHLGYAPVFSDTADVSEEWNAEGQIKYEGLGQMGQIMGEFIFNKMREGAGWAEVNTPHYKKKLWDDSDSFIKAPTMADIASMAVNIATLGSGAALSPMISAAVNLTDDLMLSTFDVATGDKTLLEGAFDFGKKAAVSFLGAGFGGTASDPIVIGNTEISSSLLDQAASNTLSGAVNAVEYSEEGGFNYNWNTLEQSVVGKGALAGYLGSAVGTVSTYGLNELNNSIDFNGFELGEIKIDQKQLGRVNSMIGGIAGEAAGSLIDGDLSLNVLNLADIMSLAGASEASVNDLGLFELHMGMDEDGNLTGYSRIGSGGAQISYRDILFDADTVFNSMARINSINEDTAAAAANRDEMLGIEGRVLDNSDIDFKGNSEVAGLLLYQLDQTRSSKSYENLVNLFQSDSRVGDQLLDSQLAKALEMGDLKGDRMLDMLKNKAFNTAGSYELAERYFDQGRGLTAFADDKLGESGFDSGYYVKSQYEAGNEAQLEDIYGGIVNWFAEDENGISIVSNAEGLLGGNVFDVESHITEMLYSGDFSMIEENLMEVGGFSQTLYDAMQTIVDEINGDATNDNVTEKLGTFAAGLAAFEEYLEEHPEIELENLEITGFDHEKNTCFDEKSGYYLPFSISGEDDVLFIHTKGKYDLVDSDEALATGRDVGSLREHDAIDVGMRIKGDESRYQLTAQDMDISLKYNDDGLWVNSVGQTLMRESTHNTARSLELLTRAVLGGNGFVNDNGTIHIAAGYVIGQSGINDQGYDSVTGPSTGPHSHEITSTINKWGEAIENPNWLKNTFSSHVSETQDASVFSGIKNDNPIVDNEFLRVKYMWDNRNINSNYFNDYMESNYGIDNADWQDYLKAFYWESYTSYMHGMGY